ncbi:MAG: hypothetical protein O9284_01335 [Steroidobacteraceae bacterium]|jgi:hypothetical protein|nr:hypothetical protein [Steroidobacteraceae bacterium]
MSAAPDIGPPPAQCLDRFRAIREMVGNTPPLAVQFRYPGQPRA